MGSVRLPFAIAASAVTAIFACSAYDEAAPGTPIEDGGTDAPPPSDGDAEVDATPPQPWLPPEGTYRYRVDGRQFLSVESFGFAEYRDEGPIAPAEIRYEAAPGCFRFRLCLVSGKCDEKPPAAYSEIAWSFCAVGDHLEERAMRETSQWPVLGDVRRAVSEVTCEPGQSVYATLNPSTTPWSHVCSGLIDGKADLAFATSGSYQFLGEEDVMIGGVAVRGYHFAQSRDVKKSTLLNAPDGKQIAEWWIGANGLPLRIRRGAEIDTNVGFGIAHFRQMTKTPYDAGPGGQTMNDCVLDSLDPGPLPIVDAGVDAAAPSDAGLDASADGG